VPTLKKESSRYNRARNPTTYINPEFDHLKLSAHTGKKKAQEQVDWMWDAVWQSQMKKMPEFREKDFSAATLQRILGSLSNWSNPPSQVRNKQPWRTIRQQVSKNETWFNGNTGKGAYTVIDRVD
jgi:hypothetical protein